MGDRIGTDCQTILTHGGAYGVQSEQGLEVRFGLNWTFRTSKQFCIDYLKPFGVETVCPIFVGIKSINLIKR